MYARISTYQADPTKLNELATKFKELKAELSAIPGVVDIYAVWRFDGQGIITAIYENQASALASTSQVQTIWDGMKEILTAAPQVEVYENVEHLTG